MVRKSNSRTVKTSGKHTNLGAKKIAKAVKEVVRKRFTKKQNPPTEVTTMLDVSRVVIKNKAQCLKCKDIIESKFRHDFVSCKCGAIFVDGGNDYWRWGGNRKAFKRIEEN